MAVSVLWGISPIFSEWDGVDLGNPSISGAHSYDSMTDEVTLQSNGDGFGGDADQGYFLSGAVGVGDSVSTQIVSLPTGGLGDEVAGIAIRSSDEADAAGIALLVQDDGTLTVLIRLTDGGVARILTFSSANTSPYLKLVRGQNAVFAYISSDGVVWDPLVGYDVTLLSSSLGGLVVASGDSGSTVSVDFAEVFRGGAGYRTEVTMDEDEATFTGSWNVRSAAGNEILLNGDYRDDQGISKGAGSVIFFPDIPLDGSYEVYARWSSGVDRDTDIPFEVTDALAQTDPLSVDQTTGGEAWIPLGVYEFEEDAIGQQVEITNSGTTGLVTIDAVKFVGTGWVDTDTDELPDAWEMKFFSTLDHAGSTDVDSDGLSNLVELYAGTNPTLGDSDGDGINDALELNTYGTNPNLADSDGDGMPDGWELVNNLDPVDPLDAGDDLDGDGLTNLEEFQALTDPDDVDTDGDGIDDFWEILNLLDPLDPDDAALDFDEDGWSNWEEYLANTDPNDDGDPVSTTPKFENLTWRVVTDLEVVDEPGLGGKLERAESGPAWDAEVVSEKLFPADGVVRFRFTSVEGESVVGLNALNESPGFTDLDYAIYGAAGTVKIYENGVFEGDFGSYGTLDVFSIERVEDEIHYVRNGVIFHSSTVLSSEFLLVEAGMDDTDGGVNRIQALGLVNSLEFPEYDTDGDGLPNGWEILHGLDPTDADDAHLDADGDGLSNLEEFMAGTDPNDGDSDGDSFSDYLEVSAERDPTEGEVPSPQTLDPVGPTGLSIFAPVKNYVE